MISISDCKKYLCIGAMAVPRFNNLWIIFGFANKDKSEISLIIFQYKFDHHKIMLQPNTMQRKKSYLLRDG